MQNLTSLVNNPRRDTFLDKLGSAVKNKIDGNRVRQAIGQGLGLAKDKSGKRNQPSKQKRQAYKPLTEKEVPDSPHIKKVKKKEMQRHV